MCQIFKIKSQTMKMVFKLQDITVIFFSFYCPVLQVSFSTKLHNTNDK